MCQGSGWVGGSNKSEGALGCGIGEGDLSIFEGVGSICDTIIDVAINIGVSNEAVNDFGSTHVITISNTKIINLDNNDL